MSYGSNRADGGVHGGGGYGDTEDQNDSFTARSGFGDWGDSTSANATGIGDGVGNESEKQDKNEDVDTAEKDLKELQKDLTYDDQDLFAKVVTSVMTGLNAVLGDLGVGSGNIATDAKNRVKEMKGKISSDDYNAAIDNITLHEDMPARVSLDKLHDYVSGLENKNKDVKDGSDGNIDPYRLSLQKRVDDFKKGKVQFANRLYEDGALQEDVLRMQKSYDEGTLAKMNLSEEYDDIVEKAIAASSPTGNFFTDGLRSLFTDEPADDYVTPYEDFKHAVINGQMVYDPEDEKYKVTPKTFLSPFSTVAKYIMPGFAVEKVFQATQDPALALGAGKIAGTLNNAVSAPMHTDNLWADLGKVGLHTIAAPLGVASEIADYVGTGVRGVNTAQAYAGTFSTAALPEWERETGLGEMAMAPLSWQRTNHKPRSATPANLARQWWHKTESEQPLPNVPFGYQHYQDSTPYGGLITNNSTSSSFNVPSAFKSRSRWGV